MEAPSYSSDEIDREAQIVVRCPARRATPDRQCSFSPRRGPAAGSGSRGRRSRAGPGQAVEGAAGVRRGDARLHAGARPSSSRARRHRQPRRSGPDLRGLDLPGGRRSPPKRSAKRYRSPSRRQGAGNRSSTGTGTARGWHSRSRNATVPSPEAEIRPGRRPGSASTSSTRRRAVRRRRSTRSVPAPSSTCSEGAHPARQSPRAVRRDARYAGLQTDKSREFRSTSSAQ